MYVPSPSTQHTPTLPHVCSSDAGIDGQRAAAVYTHTLIWRTNTLLVLTLATAWREGGREGREGGKEEREGERRERGMEGEREGEKEGGIHE